MKLIQSGYTLKIQDANISVFSAIGTYSNQVEDYISIDQ